MYFPTRRYDGGALPAGRYDAVRLDIGTRRAGRNWWCVLYPGLCRSACGGYDTPAENDLVCGEYIVRFRFVEWWGGLTAPREDVVLALEAIVEPVSLYEPVFSDGGDTIYIMDQVGDPTGDGDWLEEIAVKQAIQNLSPREKKILSLRFLEGCTQVEVAGQIGISQALSLIHI